MKDRTLAQVIRGLEFGACACRQKESKETVVDCINFYRGLAEKYGLFCDVYEAMDKENGL